MKLLRNDNSVCSLSNRNGSRRRIKLHARNTDISIKRFVAYEGEPDIEQDVSINQNTFAPNNCASLSTVRNNTISKRVSRVKVSYDQLAVQIGLFAALVGVIVGSIHYIVS